MKITITHYLTVSLLAIFCQFSTAQGNINDSWANQVNNTFQHLDKSKIQSGILLDYAIEFTDVTAYNGTITDSTFINTNVMGNIYKTLFMGKVVADTTNTPLLRNYGYNWAKERYNATRDSAGVYVLSGLLYEYQKFNENALASNKITVSNNKYYDKYIGSVWQNPYDTELTFALTPPVHKTRHKDIYFKLPQTVFLSNIRNQIASITLNADNGQGYQNIPFDGIIPVSFYENKLHNLTFKLTLTNGQTLYCRSKFKVNDPVLKTSPQARGAVDLNDEQVFIYEDGNILNSAVLTIRRIPGNDSITRPLIIAEGFDTGHITQPEVFGGDNTLDNFQEDVDFSGNNLRNLIDFNRNHTYDLIYIDWNNGTGDMRENSKILEEVIGYINDEKVLNDNGVMESNVLLGQSMGGVIGRYTLARMENEGKTHDVRLFVAHDSPMQGANVPLSTQHFFRHVHKEYIKTPLAYAFGEYTLPLLFNLDAITGGGLENLIENLPPEDEEGDEFTYIRPSLLLRLTDRPAARQLNYWSLDGFSQTPTTAYHDTWQQELELQGWPTQSRNIAISNGNECGVDNGFAPGDPLMTIDSDSNEGLIMDFIGSLVGVVVGFNTLDVDLIAVSLITGSSDWQTNFNFNTYGPIGSQNEIYWGRIRYLKKFLWIGPTITHTLTEERFNAPATALPFDTFSGGRFDLIDSENNFTFDQIPVLPNLITVNNDFYGFIPVVSALDIKKTNGNNPTPDDYLKSYSGGVPQDPNLRSSFNNFIVDNLPNQPINNPHLSFQPRNGNWLAAELEAQSPGDFPVLDNCNWACDANSSGIVGADRICSDFPTRTFSVPAGADTYQWTISSGGIVTVNGATNTNSISLTKNPDKNGWITIRVTLNSTRCGVANLTLTKRVYIGTPIVESVQSINDYPAPHISPAPDGCEAILQLNFTPGYYNDVTDIEWQKVTTDIAWSRDYYDYDDQYVVVYPDCNTTFEFRVRAYSACGGWSEWQDLEYQIIECDTNCPPPFNGIVSDNFILYPIPAHNILNFGVQPDNAWNFPSSSPFTNLNDLDTEPTIDGSGNVTYPRVRLFISFYDSMGNVVHSTIIEGLPNQIDVSSIPTGNYIMRIEYLGQIETHNIQII